MLFRRCLKPLAEYFWGWGSGELGCSELKGAVKAGMVVDSLDELGREDGAVAREEGGSTETFAPSTSTVHLQLC